jgi:hypothetical protein
VLERVVAVLQVEEATLDEVERLIEARARDGATAAEL